MCGIAGILREDVDLREQEQQVIANGPTAWEAVARTTVGDT